MSRGIRWVRQGTGLGLLLLVAAGVAAAPDSSRPIIDMHVHAYPADWVSRILRVSGSDIDRLPDPPNPVTGVRSGATTDEALLEATLAAMVRHNIVMAVASGPLDVVHRWREADPGRILGAPLFPIPELAPFPDLKQLERDYRAGRLQVLAGR